MTAQEQKIDGFKLFDMYSTDGIEVKDPALKPYINLTPKILVKSHGRQLEKQSAVRVNIIERFANRLAVPGHVGKKHKIITSWSSGKYNRNMKTILQALKIIEHKTGKNPVQVLVEAIENGSPRDEITVIESAGARYPQAVDCSPFRRINLAIRWMIQGAYAKSFGKKNKMADSLANEIMNAAKGAMESYSMTKKNEAEKQADAAR
jgi:small subunit ribosomal protein S7